MWADGGGKARGAATRPMNRRDLVAQFVLASQRLAGMYYLEEAEVNDELAMLIRAQADSNLIAVLSITVRDGKVSEVRAMANPDKLKWVNGN